MPIANGALDRWWIELSAANPAFVDDLRPSLLAFMAFGPGREASFAGTGFFIAGAPEMALAITAKHVLTEGIGRMQRPWSSRALSAVLVSSRAPEPSLNPEKLKALWLGSRHAGTMNVAHVGYNDTLDIACCVVVPQEKRAAPFQPASIPLGQKIETVEGIVPIRCAAASFRSWHTARRGYARVKTSEPAAIGSGSRLPIPALA
jgi:hypothetical protein